MFNQINIYTVIAIARIYWATPNNLLILVLLAKIHDLIVAKNVADYIIDIDLGLIIVDYSKLWNIIKKMGHLTEN